MRIYAHAFYLTYTADFDFVTRAHKCAPYDELRVRAVHPFKIDAWVLLPDHLHCLWALPPDNADDSLRWNLIKRLMTQACAGCHPDE